MLSCSATGSFLVTTTIPSRLQATLFSLSRGFNSSTYQGDEAKTAGNDMEVGNARMLDWEFKTAKRFQALAESAGKSIDIAYASIVHQLGITKRFFQEGGFGDLNVVNFHEDLSSFDSWPPKHWQDIKIDWRRSRGSSFGGLGLVRPHKSDEMYSILRGSFTTPCTGTAYSALPFESRLAHAGLILPKNPAPGRPVVLHLAATGDHGFGRREALAIPLAMKGIGSVILESPFYGMRKPKGQSGAKLRFVSDLLLLGRATIEESLFLLNWLSDQGHTKLGISGLSMGGVHSCMVAGLFPQELALTPLLAPRSAAAAYCNGALFHATGWKKLTDDVQQREDELRAVIRKAARPSLKVGAAREIPLRVAYQEGREESNGNQAYRDHAENKEKKQIKDTVEWLSSWSESFSRQMRILVESDAAHGNEVAFRRSIWLLEAVLETYTDITRFPKPKRPDAAIIVAATEDGYVDRESVMEMHQHLTGSELRWVAGGHVSSFVMHQDHFRRAIQDSILTRLA